MANFISSNLAVILLFSSALILGLGIYAGFLLSKLKQQQKQAQQAETNRLEYLFESIDTICAATLQQQCNLSEASIRIVNLLAMLDLKKEDDNKQRYPSVYTLYEAVKHHPIGKARKQTARHALRDLDAQREQKEVELESFILKELEKIREHISALRGA